jgi:DHA1 family multidrug resistance protein-like MFS transporter
MSDIWRPQQLGVISPFAISTIFAAPATGPIFGSFLVKWGSFGWLSWLTMILGGILFVLNLFVNETYVPVILRNKAIKMRHEGLNVVAPIEAMPPTLKNLSQNYVIRLFVMLVQDGALLFLSMYSSICYGLLYACLSAFPTSFQHCRHFEFVSSFLLEECFLQKEWRACALLQYYCLLGCSFLLGQALSSPCTGLCRALQAC